MNIENLQRYDPFADVGEEPTTTKPTAPQEATKHKSKTTVDGFIHVRVQQRNGRKTLTTLQGLSKGAYTSVSRVRGHAAARG